MDGVAVAARLWLRNEANRRTMKPGRLRIGRFVAGPDDNGNLFDPGGERLLDEDREQRFPVAFAVDQSLERQRALRLGGGRNNSFPD